MRGATDRWRGQMQLQLPPGCVLLKATSLPHPVLLQCWERLVPVSMAHEVLSGGEGQAALGAAPAADARREIRAPQRVRCGYPNHPGAGGCQILQRVNCLHDH